MKPLNTHQIEFFPSQIACIIPSCCGSQLKKYEFVLKLNSDECLGQNNGELFEYEVRYDSDIVKFTFNNHYQGLLVFENDNWNVEFPMQLKLDTIAQLKVGFNEGLVEMLEEEYNQLLLQDLLEPENTFYDKDSKLTKVLKTYII